MSIFGEYNFFTELAMETTLPKIIVNLDYIQGVLMIHCINANIQGL